MVADGADILDVGGESTRPGAEPLPADEELRRVLPVVERLAARGRGPVSIDTYKAASRARRSRAGAAIVNDVSGLQFDPELARGRGRTGAAVVLMHNRGRSRDMYERRSTRTSSAEVARELRRGDRAGRSARAFARSRSSSIPGFGFAKRAEHIRACWRASTRCAALDRPILSGPRGSRF